jgi:hypothetical protein
MTAFRQLAPVLILAGLFSWGFSCNDDGADPEKGPTQDEMREVATATCEQAMECGSLPGDVTLDECIANQLGSYQDSPECVALYYYDECKTMLTCEEIQQLIQLQMGQCLEESKEAGKVSCAA